MGLGMLLSALSSSGNATANVGRDYQKVADDQAAQQRMFDQQSQMEQMRSDLNVQQAQRIAENQRDLANAPIEAFSDLLKQKTGEQVPMEAPVLDGLSGSGTTSGYPGLHGDPVALRAQAMTLAPDMRDLMLKQIDQQEASDKAEAAGAVAGQTRARTPEEAMSAALADAKVNDPTAYLAGKQLNADKYMTVTGDGAVLDTTTGRVIFQNDSKNKRAAELAENKYQIAVANNDSREEIAKLRGDMLAARASNANTPSIVATANWLVENGVAKTPAEAWLMAKTSASKASSDNVVKIAGILANQPGYKPQSNTGKGKAADMFADAAVLEHSFNTAPGPQADEPAQYGAPAAAPQDAAARVPATNPAAYSQPSAPSFAPPPSAGAVDYLRKNPQLQGQFDAKYGPGASKRYLGG